ncbi:MAG: metal-sensitive transcriptional regulator [Thermaerobacter sp.]|nr:metal-sensitive transcriptional regulator [Thermaerobacter sp.]
MKNPTAMPRPVFWDVDDMIRRLRRIEGQVRGVEGMVQRAEPCQSVLTQVSAVEGAIKQVARIVSACSVAECMVSISDEALDAEQIRVAIKDLLRSG